MEKHESLGSLKEDINTLFFDYSENYNKENSFMLIIQIKEKLIVKLWKYILNFSTISKEMKDNSDIMLDTINTCLKSYIKCDTQNDFCNYAFIAIKNKLEKESYNNSFKDKIGGMKISDDRINRIKKERKLYDSYKTFGYSDENRLITSVSQAMNLSFDEVKNDLNMGSSCSEYQKDKDTEKEFSIFEEIAFNKNGKDVLNTIILDEEIISFLDKIESFWNKEKSKTKNILSEVLTVSLIQDLNLISVNEDKKDELLKILLKYNFIEKTILNNYFNNIDFVLPTYMSIAEKYKITKSAITHKIQRFIEKISN